MKKVDAYVNRAADYEELAEVTEKDFARGTFMIGGVPTKRGRGRPAPNGIAKEQITLRLDPAVIEGFRATGPGWQGRMNAVLKAWLSKQASPPTHNGAMEPG